MTVSVWLSDDAAHRKARQVIEQAYTVRISVPRRDLDEVRRAAIDAYNARKAEAEAAWQARGGAAPAPALAWRPATEDSAPAFLDRITVNYIRHSLTRYEQRLAAVTERPGVRQAADILFERVLTGIGDVYPELKPEADRQVAHRRQMYGGRGNGRGAA